MNTCKAVKLQSATDYFFKVKEVCELGVDGDGNTVDYSSFFSGTSDAVRTGPLPAGQPVNLLVDSEAETTMVLRWQPGLLNDCEFKEFKAMINRGQSACVEALGIVGSCVYRSFEVVYQKIGIIDFGTPPNY